MPIILLEMQQGQDETNETFDKYVEGTTALLLKIGWRFFTKKGETMIQIRHAQHVRLHKAQFIQREPHPTIPDGHTVEAK